MRAMLRYGALALAGIVLVVGGLMLNSLPLPFMSWVRTAGVVVFLIGAAVVVLTLVVAYRPRISRSRKSS